MEGLFISQHLLTHTTTPLHHHKNTHTTVHTKPRPIWFSRHGESQFNAQGRIGGDSPLSPRGLLYAQKLHEFVSSVYPRG